MLEGEKYMLFTTYRRDGRPVSTPVWVVHLGDSVGFWTSSASGKAKRLAHNADVIVQACDARGTPNPDSAAISATARLVTGPELEEIRRRVVQKYGITTKFARVAAEVLGTLRRKRIPYGDVGVVVTQVGAPG